MTLPSIRLATGVALASITLVALTRAEEPASPRYRTPPAPLVEAVDNFIANDVDLSWQALGVSPDRSRLIIEHVPALVPVAELAEPHWQIGTEYLSILPRRHSAAQKSAHGFFGFGFHGLTIVTIPDGREIQVGFPTGARIKYGRWSPDSRHVAVVVYRQGPGELWVVDTATGRARALTGPVLNTVGDLNAHPIQWMGNDRVLVTLIPKGVAPPSPPAHADGPDVQASDGTGGGSNLRSTRPATASDYDRRRLEYYATSELGVVSLEGATTVLGIRGVVSPDVSPDGRFILVRTALPPYRTFRVVEANPVRADIYDASGRLMTAVMERRASARSEGPFPDVVPSGRRAFAWRPDAPATLTWLETANGGDPDTPVPSRDTVQQWAAPFATPPVVLFTADARIHQVYWGNAHTAFVHDARPTPQRVRLWRIDPAKPDAPATVLFEHTADTLYRYPELPYRPLLRPVAGHFRHVLDLSQDGRGVYVRPRLRLTVELPQLYDFSTQRMTTLWKATSMGKEIFSVFLDADHRRALSLLYPKEGWPNYVIRDLAAGTITPLTKLTLKPVVAPGTLKRKRITAQREDGLPLYAHVSLPADWEPARGPLPTLFSVYAVETEEHVYRRTIEDRLKTETLPSDRPEHPLHDYPLLTQLGYAVVTFNPPIVGRNGQKPQDTFVPQLVASTKAMLDELVRRGIVDRERVGVTGHSYGGFTTASLLAHTDFFRAGIADNGLYNFTLAPFGGQAEVRTLWQARDVYVRNSPLFHADTIKAPLLILRGKDEEHLIIHPAESPTLYAAIKYLGGTARFVELPHEGHNYYGRESVLHILWEVVTWLDTHVKNAGATSGR